MLPTMLQDVEDLLQSAATLLVSLVGFDSAKRVLSLSNVVNPSSGCTFGIVLPPNDLEHVCWLCMDSMHAMFCLWAKSSTKVPSLLVFQLQ